MRIVALALLALALMLSGCTTKTSDPTDDSTQTSSSSTSTSSAPLPAPVNDAPSATVLANATVDDPLNVTFAINATDANEDNLTWRIEFGDNQSANGTMQRTHSSAPTPGIQRANVSHLYALGGNYNVTITISDGLNATHLNLNLSLAAGAPFEQFVAAGTPDFACPQCTAAGANTGVGYRTGTNELDSWFVTIPASAAGQTFVLTSQSGNPDMVFRTTCESSGTAVGDSLVGSGDETGVVPEGALCVLAWNPDDVIATITLTIG